MRLLEKVIKHLKWEASICFYYLPIKKDKIVFGNFSGKGYGCNPKYIAEELIRCNSKIKMYWIVEEVAREGFPIQIKQIKKGSFSEIFHMATAKIWVDNVRYEKAVRKKKEQFYIQTWHGGIPLKKIEGDATEYIAPWYLEVAKLDGEITDLMCASSSFEKDIYMRAFWYKGEVVCSGLPRNALFFYKEAEKDKIVKEVYRNMGIDKEKKIILYAPTFRDGGDWECFCFNYTRILSCFEKKLKKEYVMVIRLHPNVQNIAEKIVYGDKIYSASDYPDMQELLLAADILITDFSSCMFDFALQNKLVYLLIQDYDRYIQEQRSLYFRIEELPFQYAKNEEELIKLIEGFESENYLNNITKFLNDVGCIEEGKGAKILSEIIKEKIDEPMSRFSTS